MRKTTLTIVGSLLSLLAVNAASAADQTRWVYVGGHEPTRAFRSETVTVQPYALTGYSKADTQRHPLSAPLYVGSRIVAFR